MGPTLAKLIDWSMMARSSYLSSVFEVSQMIERWLV
jgi:hypothetical protein